MADTGEPGEFSPRYKGGIWAARIDTQDKVAAIVALEALGGTLELVTPDVLHEEGRLAFEAREDFELRWSSGRQYASVKDRQVTKSDLIESIKKLERLATGSIQLQTIRLEAASLNSSARSLYEDIQRLREMKDANVTEDYERACEDFSQEHDLAPIWAEKLIAMERRIGNNPTLANAIFSHAMRKALPVHNYSDADLVSLFDDLTKNVLHGKRLRRGVLDLSDLERMVLAPLTPTAIALVDTQLDGYIKTKFGYLRDDERRAEIKGEWLIVMTFARKLMKEWRRKTFWLRFKNSGLVRPAVSCISCGHPLNANYNGRKGLACPRCGYNPYVTAFYACDCGSGAVLIRQPDISAFTLVRDIYRVLREKEIRCTGCDESPRPEKLLQRMFILPIP
ncbi:MAG: hypothetical protein ACREUM_02685, partial [Nitrosospira sp.]